MFSFQVYLKNTRPEVGLWSLPNGTAYYQACLRWHLSLNISAEDVHQLGLSEVKRVSDKIEKVRLVCLGVVSSKNTIPVENTTAVFSHRSFKTLQQTSSKQCCEGSHSSVFNSCELDYNNAYLCISKVPT